MFGNTVASIVSTFTRTIAKLETLAESELVKSNDLSLKAVDLAHKADGALLESAHASTVAKKLRDIIGG